MTPWIDGLQQAIAAKLTAELPDALAALETAYGDNVPLDAPIEVWPCDKAQVAPPAVEIWCARASRVNAEDSAMDYTSGLTIVWTVAGSDEQIIDTQIKRYLLVTARILEGAIFGNGLNTAPLSIGDMTFLLVDSGNSDAPFSRSAGLAVSTSLAAGE